MFKRIKSLAACLPLIVMLAAPPADAEAARFIRDAEIENTIRAYSAPLFAAAGLNSKDVKILIVHDDTLNAFVFGGMNLFIHTGLLLKSEHAGQLIGVIAHETGHIAGGHLSRMSNRMRSASTAQIIAMILGAAAGIAGSPQAGSAILLGSGELARQGVFGFSRAQESAADQAALGYLERTGQSARGMAEFLVVMEKQEQLTVGRQPVYLRTHPITRDRIKHVINTIATSRFSDTPVRREFAEMHRRMTAKLWGFLRPPAKTLNRYKEGDDSVEARYARAIAHYRVPDLANALPLVDGLIAENPEDPYFQELKGQILFENGRGAEAIGPYDKAVRLLPDSALLRIGLARVLLEQADPSLTKRALAHLKQAVRLENENPFAWSQLAIAYGRDRQFGMSALALAEAALARGNKKEARNQAKRAAKRLKRGQAGRLRADDIGRAARKKKN
ncbi:MAG: M48 family metallopeptidase [Proteobacteria bacterium]|nr:M48 family metallopeptidase [Pseudomonadota bacterium]